MRLTFTFTDAPDLTALRREDIYTSSFDVPDEALHLIGVRERVLAIGELVAGFTHASLHLTCKELNFKHHLIKSADISAEVHCLRFSRRVFELCFKCTLSIHAQKRQILKILSPKVDSLPPYMFQARSKKQNIFINCHPVDQWVEQWAKNDEQLLFAQNILQLAQHVDVLLNAESGKNWKCVGFHPFWPDTATQTMLHNRQKERQSLHRQQERDATKALKQQEKDEAKRLKREEMIKTRAEAQPNTDAPEHGAGRRPGARPGIYKGIQMRSQLEIRFAAELDERNIRWFYESEALGDAGYLVDFYLPDLGVWVEVKGTMIAKDRQVLPDVARHLKEARSHRLMMYMQSKAYVINPSGFREIEAKRFWDELVK